MIPTDTSLAARVRHERATCRQACATAEEAAVAAVQAIRDGRSDLYLGVAASATEIARKHAAEAARLAGDVPALMQEAAEAHHQANLAARYTGVIHCIVEQDQP